MLTDAELAAIEERLQYDEYTGQPVYREAAAKYYGQDVPRLLAEVRRLRTLAAAQTGAATHKARGLQSRGRAASSRPAEAPTRARRLAAP